MGFRYTVLPPGFHLHVGCSDSLLILTLAISPTHNHSRASNPILGALHIIFDIIQSNLKCICNFLKLDLYHYISNLRAYIYLVLYITITVYLKFYNGDHCIVLSCSTYYTSVNQSTFICGTYKSQKFCCY